MKRKNMPEINPEAAVRRCSTKFRKIYRKTPVLESVFNKVAGLKEHLRKNASVNQ